MRAASSPTRAGAPRSTCCASISTTTRRRARSSTAPRSTAPASTLLADGGVMTVNLFGRDASFETQHRGASPPRSAPRRCVTVQPTKEGNTVVLAMKQVTLPGRDELARRAENIETRWQLPARKWLRMMRPVAARGRADPTASRMKIRSDPDLSKAAAAAGIRAVPRPVEPAAGQPSASRAAREPPRERRAPDAAPPATARSIATARSSARSRPRDRRRLRGDRSLAQRRLARQARPGARCSPGCATTRSSAPKTSSARRAASPAATARSTRWCGSAAPA